MRRVIGGAKMYIKVLNSAFFTKNISCATKSVEALMSHATSSYLARLRHPDSK